MILHNDTRFYKRVQSFRGRGQNVHVQEVLDEQEEAQYVTEEIQKKLDQGIKGRNCCAFPGSSPGANDFGNIKRTPYPV